LAPGIPKGDIRNWLFGKTKTISTELKPLTTIESARNEINSKEQPESSAPPKTPPPRQLTTHRQPSAMHEIAPKSPFSHPLNTNTNNLFASGIKEQQSVARLPPNTCAFISAINMLGQGTWKQETVVKAEEWGRRLITAVKGVATTEADMA
jgi:hypothetical protein